MVKPPTYHQNVVEFQLIIITITFIPLLKTILLRTFKNNEKYNTKIDQWEIKNYYLLLVMSVSCIIEGSKFM